MKERVVYTARVGERGTRKQYVVGLPRGWIDDVIGLKLGEKLEFVMDDKKPEQLTIRKHK